MHTTVGASLSSPSVNYGNSCHSILGFTTLSAGEKKDIGVTLDNAYQSLSAKQVGYLQSRLLSKEYTAPRFEQKARVRRRTDSRTRRHVRMLVIALLVRVDFDTEASRNSVCRPPRPKAAETSMQCSFICVAVNPISLLPLPPFKPIP